MPVTKRHQDMLTTPVFGGDAAGLRLTCLRV